MKKREKACTNDQERNKKAGNTVVRYGKVPRKEYIRACLEGFILCVGLDYLFYESFAAILFLCPLIFLYVRWKTLRLQKNLRRKMNREFKIALDSICVGIRAGYSAENALRSSIPELAGELPKDSEVLAAFRYMETQRRVSVPLEKLFWSFGRETGLEDIMNFAEVFQTARRTGGNLDEILEKTSRMLGEKLEVEEEIEASLAARKNEQLIMDLMPAAILLYLKAASPEFLSPMYRNSMGIILMTCCLLVYAGAAYLGSRILDITV